MLTFQIPNHISIIPPMRSPGHSEILVGTEVQNATYSNKFEVLFHRLNYAAAFIIWNMIKLNVLYILG